jgi:hypothetical protein
MLNLVDVDPEFLPNTNQAEDRQMQHHMLTLYLVNLGIQRKKKARLRWNSFCLTCSGRFVAIICIHLFLLVVLNNHTAAFILPHSATGRVSSRLKSRLMEEKTEQPTYFNNDTTRPCASHDNGMASLNNQMKDHNTDDTDHDKSLPQTIQTKNSAPVLPQKSHQMPKQQSKPNPLSGLSRAHQSMLAKTSNMRRQRFVTGKYPLYVEVKQNPTKKWLGLAESRIYLNG